MSKILDALGLQVVWPGQVQNKPLVPYTSRRTTGTAFVGQTGTSDSPLAQMGAVGTLFSIVNRLSTSTAAVEWDLYRQPKDGARLSDDEREQVTTKHAARDLLNRPNPFMTRYELVERVQQHIDLVGQGYLVVVKAGSTPIELWPVRPDRLTPVPHPDDYLAGYVYRTPDGEKIPLKVDEVISLQMPNPEDVYRGLGPVQSILMALDSSKYSAEWNRNFFLNSAEPGGVIELGDTRLTDDQWQEFVQRWNEQHKGVSRAHKIAVIEHGKYVPRGYSQRDMQFTELRTATRDEIMEVYGISPSSLGIIANSNYAAANTARAQFGEQVLMPRMRRWAEALNSQLLPMFGTTGKGVEFDHEDVVGTDVDAVNAERDSKVRAFVAIMGVPSVKFDAKAALEAFDLPDIPFEEVEPPPALAPFGQEAPSSDPRTPEDEEKAPGGKDYALAVRVANALPDGHATDWQATLDRLLEQWGHIAAGQRAELGHQIASAIDDGNLAALADLSINSDLAAERLREALVALSRKAAEQASAEAEAQGVDVFPQPPDEDVLGQIAATTAALLALGLAVAAGREALRRHDGTKTGAQVAAEVGTYLVEQSDAGLKTTLGGTLTGAQNRARADTFLSGPVGSIYATEELDASTCVNCRRIDGRFICNTDDQAALYAMYTPLGGYVDCLGGVRCRGSFTGVWRPKTTTAQAKAAEPEPEASPEFLERMDDVDWGLFGGGGDDE